METLSVSQFKTRLKNNSSRKKSTRSPPAQFQQQLQLDSCHSMPGPGGKTGRKGAILETNSPFSHGFRPIKRKMIKALFLFFRDYGILKGLAIRILTTVLAGILMGSPV